MPTGYTAELYDGEQSFGDFAMGCARAFGALVTMRDAPQGAEIPDTIEPSDHHARRLREARQRLRELDALSIDEAAARARIEYEKEIARRDADAQERASLRERYERMLQRVRDWEPPTPEHQGLKEYMAEQLEGAIDFDTRPLERPHVVLRDGGAWIAKERAEAMRDVTYHAAEHEKEAERAASRTAWVQALRDSLEDGADA